MICPALPVIAVRHTTYTTPRDTTFGNRRREQNARKALLAVATLKHAARLRVYV